MAEAFIVAADAYVSGNLRLGKAKATRSYKPPAYLELGEAKGLSGQDLWNAVDNMLARMNAGPNLG